MLALSSRLRTAALGGLSVLTLVALSACSEATSDGPAFVSNTPIDTTIVIGHVNTPADAFIATMAVTTLDRELGGNALSGGAPAARLASTPYATYAELIEALEGGDVDVAVAPLGTTLDVVSAGSEFASANVEVTRERTNAFLEEEGIEALEPSEVSGGVAVVVATSFATQNELANVADFVGVSDTALVAAPEGCIDGADSWLCGAPLVLPGGYGAELGETVGIGPDQLLDVVRDGDADAGVVSNVAPGVDSPDLTVLSDNLGYFPAQNFTFFVNIDRVRNERRELLHVVSATLTDVMVRTASTSIGLDGKTADEAVAAATSNK